MTYYIYSLSCPITKQIRYIGKTKDIKLRFRCHLNTVNSINRECNEPLYNWIEQLKSKGLLPKIDVIDKCSWSMSAQREAEHYQLHKNEYLLNKKVLGDPHTVDIMALKAIVKSKKLKTRVLSETLGINKTGLSSYLNGLRSAISYTKAKQLEAYLNSL